MPRSLTHLALHVHDLDATIAFYAELCGWEVIHERRNQDPLVVWMGEPGHTQRFVLVLLSGGPRRPPLGGDISHLGFAVQSRDEVDRIAALGKERGILHWPVTDAKWPVGYYCGILDPNGNLVEFSYGQPLGPGAAPLDAL